MLTHYYTIKGVNPMPWKAPRLGIGRKGGKQYPISYPNDEMAIYQAAIQDYIRDKYAPVPHDGLLELTIWYWRSLNFGGQRRNVCDVTNMNKALEDSLQGVLFANDMNNKIVTGISVIQAPNIEPLILIGIGPHEYTVDRFILPWEHVDEAYPGRGAVADERPPDSGMSKLGIPS